MQFPGRLSAAIDVLTDLEARHRPASAALRDWGLSHRFAGSGDRAAIGNLVYDALRRRQSLGWRVGSDTPRALILGVAVWVWEYSAQSLDDDFESSPHAPDRLTEAERSALNLNDLSRAPDHIKAECPNWLKMEIERTFGDEWISESAHLAERPPLDMRVNLLKATTGKAAQRLSALRARPTQLASTALRIAPVTGANRHPNIKANQAYLRGVIEIQDESSQVCALLADPQPKQQVLDYCAGAGGKTLAMAALMANRGQVHAHDRDPVRLAPIFERLRRAGAHNVQVVAEGRNISEELGRQMDLVLVDAPCSGSGVWRRRPDAKWRLTPEALAQRQIEQDEALSQAAHFVRPGGKLVYATCSVLSSENQDRVSHFLERHPEFEPVDLKRVWAERVPTSAPTPTWLDESSVVLSPKSTGTDGFFIASMKRLN